MPFYLFSFVPGISFPNIFIWGVENAKNLLNLRCLTEEECLMLNCILYCLHVMATHVDKCLRNFLGFSSQKLGRCFSNNKTHNRWKQIYSLILILKSFGNITKTFMRHDSTAETGKSLYRKMIYTYKLSYSI